MSPSIQPASGAVAWVAGGMDHVVSLGTTATVFGYAWLVTVAATSACDARASTYGTTPTTEGTTSVSASSVRSDVGGRITSVVVCSVTPEGAPSAPVST